MIADIEPYPEYQDSELPWLGQVPGHWERLRLKRILRPIDHRSVNGSETLLSLRREHGIVKYAEHFSRPPQGATMVGFKLVQAGQLVVNRMQANNGLVFHSSLDGLVSPDYSVFEAKVPLRVDYLSELLRTPQYRAHFRRESTGLGTGSAGFLRLYDDRLLGTTIAVPPLPEQEAIMRFLAQADRGISRYVRAKRKVIALLNEQKQGIVHRAVTRGLDPSVPLKPSGIPWLSEIPQHWEVLALKRVLRKLIDCEHKTAPQVAQSDYRVVRTTAIRYGALRLRGTYCTSPGAFRTWTRRGLPEAGDVIFTREAPAGEACIVPEGMNLCLGQRTVLMKPNTRLNPEFLVEMLYVGPPRELVHLASQGSTVGHFNVADIGSLAILLPPRQEQDYIVKAVRGQTAELARAISRLEREVDLLREYRTCLVADVVTGKLDVREAASRLPVEAITDADPELSAETLDENEDVDESDSEVLLNHA